VDKDKSKTNSLTAQLNNNNTTFGSGVNPEFPLMSNQPADQRDGGVDQVDDDA